MFKSYPLLSRLLLFVVIPVSAGLIACLLYLRGSLPVADGRVIKADVSQRVELSQTELGNFAGMSREHINRQLKSWEESGVISLEQGRVRVLDADMLEDISESEG